VGNSCVEGREVKCFNVIVWGIVVSKAEKSKCFNVIVWGIVVSKAERSNVLMLLCGE
jgi:hypothetical protein